VVSVPTYTYQCTKCGHEQDVFHSMTATVKVKCAKCKGRCEKMIGIGAGIIFKGSGFYETDYKKKGTPPSGETKPESKSESKPAESKKTESKPAESSSAKPSKKSSAKD